MSESNYISIKGAKVNNLKNIDVNIPRNKLVVITGLSGFHQRYTTRYRHRAKSEQPQSSFHRGYFHRNI